MDEELDDILKNRIKEVFENFEDSSADEGWLLLREKYPEKQSKRRAIGWLWWGSAAAVLLVFLGIGLWRDNKGVSPEKSIVKINSTNDSKLQLEERQPHKVDELAATGPKKSSSNLNAGTSQTNIRPAGEPEINHYRRANVKSPIAYAPTIENNPSQRKPADSTNVPIFNPSKALLATAKQPDSSAVSVKARTPKTEQSINTMFAERQTASPKKDEKNASESKKVHFSVYAATYVNYAKGSSTEVNAGAGFSSDIKLSKKLKLVTGIAIGQNTLNYGAATPQPAVSSAAAFKNGLQLASANVKAPVLAGYNASLVGLDIPLNLKYEFNPKKSDTYIIAGLSSGTFINELYTYHYSYDLQPSSSQATTNRQAFNGFYFAKTLNLAFGAGYPLGKSNRLIIEPFFKYPLDGLGSQQIRFGAGGINLKLSFLPKK